MDIRIYSGCEGVKEELVSLCQNLFCDFQNSPLHVTYFFL